jgi:hypothetical protein
MTNEDGSGSAEWVAVVVRMLNEGPFDWEGPKGSERDGRRFDNVLSGSPEGKGKGMTVVGDLVETVVGLLIVVLFEVGFRSDCEDVVESE